MSIKSSFAKSGLWMVAGAVFNNLSSMIIFIVLARLLTPTQFGIVAFATIFIELSRIFIISGIPDALVQRPEWDDDVASSAFWANIGLASALCVAIGGIAGPIAYIYYDRTFALVLIVLSLALLIEALTTVHTAKLRRDFRYKAIAGRNMIANVLGGVLGIALAAYGWGVWSLVISRLVSASLTSIILWHSSGWLPGFQFRWGHVHSMSAMSAHLLGNQFVGQANAQIPGLIIGSVIGPAGLAQFRVGTRILNLMTQLLITPLQTPAMSAFSRLDNQNKPIGPAYLRVTRLCSLLACPVFFGAAAVGPDFIRIVFGEKWNEAGWIMALNGLAVGPSVIMYLFTPALASAGRSGLSFRHFIAAFFTNILVAICAIPFGLYAIASGKTIESHLTLPYGLTLLRQGLGVGAIDTLRSIAPAYFAALVMAASVALLGYFGLQGLNSVSRLLVMVASGGVIYVAVLMLTARRFLTDTIQEFAPLFENLRGRVNGLRKPAGEQP